MNDTLTLGNLPPNPPPNPEVQRAAQHLLQGITDGKIIGLSYIGITSTGELISAHALPGTPSVLYMAIGGMQGIISDLIDFIKQLRQQQNVSRILKPTAAMMRPNG